MSGREAVAVTAIRHRGRDLVSLVGVARRIRGTPSVSLARTPSGAPVHVGRYVHPDIRSTARFHPAVRESVVPTSALRPITSCKRENWRFARQKRFSRECFGGRATVTRRDDQFGTLVGAARSNGLGCPVLNLDLLAAKKYGKNWHKDLLGPWNTTSSTAGVCQPVRAFGPRTQRVEGCSWPLTDLSGAVLRPIGADDPVEAA